MFRNTNCIIPLWIIPEQILYMIENDTKIFNISSNKLMIKSYF